MAVETWSSSLDITSTNVQTNIEIYWNVNEPAFGGFTLYIHGVVPNDNPSLYDSDGLLTLFIEGGGNPVNNSIDLYMYGKELIDTSLNLFTTSSYGEYGSVDLFMGSAYVLGDSLNLFSKADGELAFNSVDLSLFSSNSNYLYNAFEIYIENDGTVPSLNDSMNLFIFNEETGYSNGYMNLYIKSDEQKIDSNIDLFIKNSYESAFNSAKLFIKGEGSYSGFLPANGDINLFIERNTSDYITLYIRCDEGVNNSVDLWIAGGQLGTGSVDLSIPYVTDTKLSSINLYTHGYR